MSDQAKCNGATPSRIVQGGTSNRRISRVVGGSNIAKSNVKTIGSRRNQYPSSLEVALVVIIHGLKQLNNSFDWLSARTEIRNTAVAVSDVMISIFCSRINFWVDI